MIRILQWYFAYLARFMPRVSTRLAVRLFLTPGRYPVQSAAGRELLASAERRTLLTDAGSIVVYRWRSAGPRVLVLHGWSDCAANLGELVRRLLDEGYDVTAPDLPAHGASSGKRTNMREWLLAIRTLAVNTADWHAVVAHSLGAFAAATATRRDVPQYGPAVRTDRLVLIAPPNRSMDMLRMFGGFLSIPADILASAERELSLIIHAQFSAFSTAHAVAEFSGDAMIIHDRDDQRVPFTHFEAIRNTAPNHYHVETSGLGHRRLLADDATLNAIVGFLDGSPTEVARMSA